MKKRNGTKKPRTRVEGIEITHSGEELLSIIFNELARTRARHRSLVDVLVSGGLIKTSDYIQEYKQSEPKDLMAFLDMMLLPRDEFKAKHKNWLKEYSSKFGFARKQKAAQISFEPVPSPDDRDEPKPK